MAEGQNKRRN